MGFFSKHRMAFIYGGGMAFVLLLLRWLEWKFILVTYRIDVYIGLIALLFTLLGVWIAMKIVAPRKIAATEKGAPGILVPSADRAAADKIGISSRELEVLTLMAAGMSNEEIAKRLFVSESTVKTHNSNIFSKLDVKRRTQAVQRARALNILADRWLSCE